MIKTRNTTAKMALCTASLVIAVCVLKQANADTVSQTAGAVTVREGDAVSINCTYSAAVTPSLFWYVQFPSEAPRLLLTRYEAGDEEDEKRRRGFSADFQKDSSSFRLRKPSSQASDSAVYYCALRGGSGGGGYKVTFGRGTSLMVKPDLPDSTPSIYKLESSKADISACLITDYFPDNITITDSEGSKSFQSSIVEVKDPGSNTKEASYGTVYWSQSHFKGTIEYGLDYSARCVESAEDEEDTCTTMELSHDFETDEHLNLMSFMVLGMKVVFLKGVSCNLLMTFLAWKS